MDKTILIEKLQQHQVIKQLFDLFSKYNSICLVGGAVIDVLEDRIPKDYDIIGWVGSDKDKLINSGFKFQYATKTALTFQKEDIILQLLNTKKEDFEYTISQSALSLNDKKTLTIDEISYENKILIPTKFDSRRVAIEALRRVPHWNKKGYKLPEQTYFSLLNIISKTKSDKS